MHSIDARLERLETRLSEVEDQLALYQILATYGPGVGSMTPAPVRDLWTEDGASMTRAGLSLSWATKSPDIWRTTGTSAVLRQVAPM